MVTRNEGIRLRPFLGVNEIQEGMNKTISLMVDRGASSFQLYNGDKLPVFPNQVGKLGLSLKLESDRVELENGFVAAKLVPADVNLVIRIRDRSTGVLRDSEIIGEASYSDLRASLSITERDAPRKSYIADNQFTGFKLEVYLVLGKTKDYNPLVPWLKGSILGSASFEFSSVPQFDSIQPIELTKEIRDQKGLPNSTWAYVDFADSFLEADELEGCLSFFVDKEILTKIKGQRRDIALAGESLLAGILIPQIVMRSALELAQNNTFDSWDGESGVLLRYLQNAFGKEKDPGKFVVKLKESPELVTSVILGRKDLGTRLGKLFEKLTQGASDVSDAGN
jgi:hypothetical protein